jgi:hypothetical protein
MLYDLTTVRARQAVRLAKENLRKSERRFDRYPGGDQDKFISEIRAAEEHLAIARVSLRILQDGAPASRLSANSGAVGDPANRPSQDEAE